MIQIGEVDVRVDSTPLKPVGQMVREMETPSIVSETEAAESSASTIPAESVSMVIHDGVFVRNGST